MGLKVSCIIRSSSGHPAQPQPTALKPTTPGTHGWPREWRQSQDSGVATPAGALCEKYPSPTCLGASSFVLVTEQAWTLGPTQLLYVLALRHTGFVQDCPCPVCGTPPSRGKPLQGHFPAPVLQCQQPVGVRPGQQQLGQEPTFCQPFPPPPLLGSGFPSMGMVNSRHLSRQCGGGNRARPCWDCTAYRRNWSSQGEFALALDADLTEETSNANTP